MVQAEQTAAEATAAENELTMGPAEAAAVAVAAGPTRSTPVAAAGPTRSTPVAAAREAAEAQAAGRPKRQSSPAAESLAASGKT
jgi:hypothetical protein